MKSGQSNKRKFSGKKLYKYFFRALVCVLICLVIAVVPTLCISLNSPVEEKFTTKVSKFKGVLELWNIDTFEGGTASKNSFLTSSSISFESTHKGLYIMVKNYTEEECKIALASGQRPAMISYGIGMGESVIDYIMPISGGTKNAKVEFLEGGKLEDKQYAAPWCTGLYSLISTTKNLESTGKTTDMPLSSIITSCGKQTTLKNGKTKTTYSVSFGEGGYPSPARSYYNNFSKIVNSATGYSAECASKTPYGAYCDFVEGKSNILLGTQRDLARIENRYSQGKIDGVIYEHLGGYTDLVQYVSIVKTDNTEVYNACINFIEYLLSSKIQQNLAKIGMYSVSLDSIYNSGEWQTAEKVLLKPMIVQNVFTTNSQLKANKNQVF